MPSWVRANVAIGTIILKNQWCMITSLRVFFFALFLFSEILMKTIFLFNAKNHHYAKEKLPCIYVFSVCKCICSGRKKERWCKYRLRVGVKYILHLVPSVIALSMDE